MLLPFMVSEATPSIIVDWMLWTPGISQCTEHIYIKQEQKNLLKLREGSGDPWDMHLAARVSVDLTRELVVLAPTGH